MTNVVSLDDRRNVLPTYRPNWAEAWDAVDAALKAGERCVGYSIAQRFGLEQGTELVGLLGRLYDAQFRTAKEYENDRVRFAPLWTKGYRKLEWPDLGPTPTWEEVTQAYNETSERQKLLSRLEHLMENGTNEDMPLGSMNVPSNVTRHVCNETFVDAAVPHLNGVINQAISRVPLECSVMVDQSAQALSLGFIATDDRFHDDRVLARLAHRVAVRFTSYTASWKEVWDRTVDGPVVTVIAAVLGSSCGRASRYNGSWVRDGLVLDDRSCRECRNIPLALFEAWLDANGEIAKVLRSAPDYSCPWYRKPLPPQEEAARVERLRAEIRAAFMPT